MARWPDSIYQSELLKARLKLRRTGRERESGAVIDTSQQQTGG